MLRIKQTILLTVIMVLIVVISGCTSYNGTENSQDIESTPIEKGNINPDNTSTPVSDSTLSDRVIITHHY